MDSEEGVVLDDTLKVEEGNTVAETEAPTYNGAGDKVATGWFKDKEATANEFQFGTEKVERDITLYGKWVNAVTVSFNLSDVTISGTIADQKIATGTTATKPDSPEAVGYKFEDWYLQDQLESGSAYNFESEVNADTELYAKWSCKVTFISSDSRTELTEDPIYVVKGKTITVATPGTDTGNESKTITGWTKGSVGGTTFNTASDTVDEPLTLYAVVK